LANDGDHYERLDMKHAKADSDAVEGSARSPHAYMREAMGAKSRLIEQRLALVRAALAAEEDALSFRQGYSAAAVDAYFEARAAERSAALPQLQVWRK
jgi:hypothetical protein